MIMINIFFPGSRKNLIIDISHILFISIDIISWGFVIIDWMNGSFIIINVIVIPVIVIMIIIVEENLNFSFDAILVI